MWELDCEEGSAPKNWCFWTVVLEKTLESPLDCKEIQPVHSEGGQPWDFFGGNDAEAEAPVLWPPHVNSWLIGKDSDAGKDCGQEEKGTTAGGQREELRPWQGSWGRRLGIRKGVIKPQDTPCSGASTPKPESVLFSHLHLWLYWGLSPITISLREAVNLQLQGKKNSWAWQECFSFGLLWRLSSPPV